MCAIEILELFVCVCDVLGRFPGVVFPGEALPLDEVLQLSTTLPGAQDLFDLKLFVAVDNVRRRRRGFLLVLSLGREVRREERLVEDGIDGLPCLQELETICRLANLLCDLEGAIAPVVKLL